MALSERFDVVQSRTILSLRPRPPVASITRRGGLPTALCKAASIQPFRNDSFHISKSGIAGWGAWAAKDLRRGEIILQELPILKASPVTLYEEFSQLDANAKGIILKLHANELLKPGTPQIQAIWTTNW